VLGDFKHSRARVDPAVLQHHANLRINFDSIFSRIKPKDANSATRGSAHSTADLHRAGFASTIGANYDGYFASLGVKRNIVDRSHLFVVNDKIANADCDSV
jgi:hypothetical protein